MPVAVDKSVNFLLTKFTPKAGQIDLRLRIPGLDNINLNFEGKFKFYRTECLQQE